ncbi:MAG: hypothetical protein H6745_22005 [Deltaproteobacteria bacterium]|nr:hypothetical protein [Deltaproteobacteria bacterium]
MDARRSLLALVVVCALAAACGDDGAASSGSPAVDVAPLACPAGTTPWAKRDAAELVRWCKDGDGLAHGPYERAVGDVVAAAGQFDRGRPDGAWTFADDATGDLTLAATYRQGLVDGVWTGYVAGAVTYTHAWKGGVACGVWTEYDAESGAPAAVVTYAPCDGLDDPPPPPPPNAAPDEPPTWDRASCPAGAEVAVEDHVTACVSATSGLREGPYAEVFAAAPDAVAVEGAFAAGEPAGTWRWYDLSGALLARGAYVAGARDGAWWWWGADGLPRDAGTYVAGAREGAWTSYGAFGLPVAEGAYAADLKVGVWRAWWDTGVPKAEETWVAGALDGPATRYFPSGAVESAGSYSAGLETGSWTTRWPSGRTRCEQPWAAGLRDGLERCWDPAGDPLIELTWRAGAMDGPTRSWSVDPLALERVRTESTLVANLFEGPAVSRWESNEALAAEWTWVENLAEGAYREYWPNGQLRLDAFKVGGRFQFTARWYFDDGTPWIEATMVQDVALGPYAEWWPDGSLRRRGERGDGGAPILVWECGDEGGPVVERDYGAFNQDTVTEPCE